MRVREYIDRHPVGRWLTNFVLIMILFGVAFVVDARSAGREDRNEQRDYLLRLDFCRDLEAVRTYARDAAQRAMETLPTLAYYKQHPNELERAMEEVARQRTTFSPPRDCKAFANGLR